MRRLFAYIAALVLVCTAACGTDSQQPDASRTATQGTAFPVTIHQAQGSVTIRSRPHRVIALGAADVQIARALGADIVGAAGNDYSPDHQWPGVQPALPSSVARLSWTKPDIEKIAALRPDLILMTTAQPGYTQIYSKLSKLAPTVSYQKGILEDSGVDLTRTLGKALGATSRAERLIASSHTKTTAFKHGHPGLVHKKVVFGQYVSGALYLVVAPHSPSVEFFASIGMSLPGKVARLPVQAPPGVSQISGERVSVLDTADYAILGVQDPRDKPQNPLLTRTRLDKDGRLKFITFNLANVLLAPNPATTSLMLKTVENVLRPG